MHISKLFIYWSLDILYSHVYNAITKWQVSDISGMSNFKSACIIQNAVLFIFNSLQCLSPWQHTVPLPPQFKHSLRVTVTSYATSRNQVWQRAGINQLSTKSKTPVNFLALSRLSVDLKIQVLFIRVKGIMAVKKRAVSRWEHQTESTCVRSFALKTNGYLL